MPVPDAVSSLKKKVVQIELEPDDYETLLTLAKSRSMTIKEAAGEALRLWTAQATDLRKDPLFKLKPVEFKMKVRSDEIEAFRFYLSTAERETDKFHGNVNALIKAHKSVRSVGGNVSENIDRALAEKS